MPEPERKMVYVGVFEGHEGDEGWPIAEGGGPLADAIGWFQNRLAEIPEQHRASAACRIHSDLFDYEDHSGRIAIWYTRPETDEEYESRMKEREKFRERLRLQNESAARVANRGPAKETVRGLGPILDVLRHRGLTE